MGSLVTNLQRLRATLLAQAPRIAETYGRVLLASLTLRIQRDGLPGARYSTKPVSTSWFADRALNSAGRAYIKDNKKGTWGAFRAAQGLPNGAVNLTYTGRMFRSLTVAQGGNTGTVFRAKIVASERESAAVVGYNQDRYGDFLQPTVAEVAAGRDYVRAEAARLIKEATTA